MGHRTRILIPTADDLTRAVQLSAENGHVQVLLYLMETNCGVDWERTSDDAVAVYLVTYYNKQRSQFVKFIEVAKKKLCLLKLVNFYMNIFVQYNFYSRFM